MKPTFPATIDEVLTELDHIITQSIASNDARGIFAYVYRRTTAEIQIAINDSEFEDNDLMHDFDVAFANYYIRAYREFDQGTECSLVWSESFNGCKEKLTVMQHILLGMNAHINLDLALTAAIQGKGKNIADLKNDFLVVNLILERIVNELQQRVSRVSPLFFVVDWLWSQKDEKFINFSMVKAREQAWRLAVALHQLDEAGFQQRQKSADQAFTLFAQKIRKPNTKLLRWILSFISRFEEKRVGRIIEKMRE